MIPPVDPITTLKTINVWTPLDNNPTTVWGVPQQDTFSVSDNASGLFVKRG